MRIVKGQRTSYFTQFASSIVVHFLSFLLGESGLLASNYCNPPNQDCFNGKMTDQFNLAFLETPGVTVGLIHLDLDNSQNIRVATTDSIQNNRDTSRYIAYEASPTEVSVNFTCWFTSRCFQAAAPWMACGLVAK